MSNVINLFGRTQKTQADTRTTQEGRVVPQMSPAAQESADKTDFQAIAARNAAVRERMQKERSDANKSVLRSYRIK